MADAIEGFQWLREMVYSVNWFTQHVAPLSEALGCLGYTPRDSYRSEVAEQFRAALDHSGELDRALKQLLDIVEDRTDG